MSKPPRCVEALGDVVAWTRRHSAVATAAQFSRGALGYRHLARTERRGGEKNAPRFFSHGSIKMSLCAERRISHFTQRSHMREIPRFRSG
jgi:hypothetical protein